MTADILTETAAAMVKSGLKDAGYIYVNRRALSSSPSPPPPSPSPSPPPARSPALPLLLPLNQAASASDGQSS